MAHHNLALFYSTLNNKELALEILTKAATDIDDDGLKDPKVHAAAQVSSAFNAGKILVELGRPSEALKILHQAADKAQGLSRSPQSPTQGIYNLLGEAYSAVNDSAKAEQWFKAALAFKPDHLPAYLTYGKLLAKNVSIVFISQGNTTG